ncbi:hypothetical protein KSF78_0002169 [Schistosoma japonicum]|nr:hypothetical protein KSF78_0002169 [Schistosoma japonicum]KAH8855846.1 hypothetical protein KSF78_0002169 [Schistosoma japonicum]
MSLWLQVSLLLLYTVILASSVPALLQKHELEESDSFNNQLTEEEASQPRGHQSTNRLGSRRNDSSTGERRSHRRRRKHNNRQCDQAGNCPEALKHIPSCNSTFYIVMYIPGGNWRRAHKRGRKRRARCNSDDECPEGQTCKERRHSGRKHGNTLAASSDPSQTSLQHSASKSSVKKFCRERRSGGHRKSGSL